MNGKVEGVTQLVNSGSSSQRWDLVILGDGFRTEELSLYASQVNAIVEDFLSTPPFDELRAAINIHRINVVSNESGAGDEIRGIRRATYFNSAFGARGVDRLLVTNESLALDVAIDAVPEMNAALMLVNSETYGGSGGAVPVFSRATGAARIAIHEMGHSHFGLADEYAYYADCADPNRADYTGDEPAEPNVTATLPDLKWSKFQTPGFPLPTMPNPDPNDCNPQPSPVPDGTVGAFEGARYFRRGMYRPAFRCFMRELSDPFCDVCQNTIRRVLAPYRPKKRRSVAT